MKTDTEWFLPGHERHYKKWVKAEPYKERKRRKKGKTKDDSRDGWGGGKKAKGR